MTTVAHPDLGRWFKGPAVFGDLVKFWERYGDVLAQTRDFIREQCVPDKRAHRHEMGTWAQFIELALCVDQLNPEGCLCLEVAGRRLSLLQFAYQSVPRGGNPDFSMSQEWMGLEGLHMGEAAIGQAHQAHVASQLQEKALTMEETRKANEELRLKNKPSRNAAADAVTAEAS